MPTNETSSLNNLINYRFYEILLQRIKCGVVKCVESNLGDYTISHTPRVVTNIEITDCKDTNEVNDSAEVSQ